MFLDFSYGHLSPGDPLLLLAGAHRQLIQEGLSNLADLDSFLDLLDLKLLSSHITLDPLDLGDPVILIFDGIVNLLDDLLGRVL